MKSNEYGEIIKLKKITDERRNIMANTFDIKVLKQFQYEDIKNLTNEKLISIMFSLNKNQLMKVGIMSIYDSIYGCMEIVELVEKQNTIKKIESEKERQQVLDCYYKLTDIVRNIDETIKEDCGQLDILKDIRKKLYDLMTFIDPYIIEVSYIEETANYYLSKKLAEKEFNREKVEQHELNRLYMDISNYLISGEKDYYVFNEKVSNIVGMIPFRITKGKFFEILKTSLGRNLAKYPKKYVDYEIKNYKKIFNGAMESSYGIKYDDYFRKVQELKYSNFKDNTIEKLGEISGKARELYLELQEVYIVLRNMGVLTNRLIVVFLTSELINDVKLNEKILSMWKQNVVDFDEFEVSKLKKLLTDEISYLEKDIFEANEVLEKVSCEVVNRKDLINDELNDELLFTKKVLTYYNDFSLQSEDILFIDEKSAANLISQDYLDEILHNFIQYLNRNISTMSNLERKLRMRRLLSSIEFPFERPEDFMDYIQASLDPTVTSKEEIILSMKSVYYLMNIDNLKDLEE